MLDENSTSFHENSNFNSTKKSDTKYNENNDNMKDELEEEKL